MPLARQVYHTVVLSRPGHREMVGWKAHVSRIITIHSEQRKTFKTNVIQCYAPMKGSDKKPRQFKNRI